MLEIVASYLSINFKENLWSKLKKMLKNLIFRPYLRPLDQNLGHQFFSPQKSGFVSH